MFSLSERLEPNQHNHRAYHLSYACHFSMVFPPGDNNVNGIGNNALGDLCAQNCGSNGAGGGGGEQLQQQPIRQFALLPQSPQLQAQQQREERCENKYNKTGGRTLTQMEHCFSLIIL